MSFYKMEGMIDAEQFRVYYTQSILDNCNMNVDTHKCFIWQLGHNKGYGHMSYTYKCVSEDGLISHKRTCSPHRLIFACQSEDTMYLLNKAFQHTQVSHICHTPLCCNLRHMVLETKEENGSRNKCKAKRKCCDSNHNPACIFFD